MSAAAAIGIGHGGRTAPADDYWKGGAGDFSTAMTWNTGSVPTAPVNADIYDGGQVTISTTIAPYDIRVGTGGTAGLQSGTGSVLQVAGSSATVSGWLRVSTLNNASSASGVYDLLGGTITVDTGNVDVGETGTGTMNVNGGILNASGGSSDYVYIGGVTSSKTADQGAGVGILNLSSGTVNTTDVLTLGAFGASNGTINVNGGTFNDTGTSPITAGNANGSTGSINVSAGAFNVSGALPVLLGSVAGGAGVFNVTSGSVNLTSPTDSNMIEIGSVTGATGTMNITGGTVTDYASEVWIGKYGTGVLNVNTNGVLDVGDWIAIGRNGGSGVVNLGPGGTITKTPGSAGNITFAGATNVLNQTGGTLNNTGSDTWIGQTGTSVYNLSGGTTNLAAVVLATDSGANGTINLTGGTLSVTQIEMGAGTSGIVNFNGGTLQASAGGNAATAGSFLTGLTEANVLAGGAVINTNGQNVTVSQSLLHPTERSPDGGLTKNGTGNLTLTSAGTYTGGTAVTAGSLTVANPGALGTGTVTLTGNSTLVLAGNGTVTGFPGETLNGGATLSGQTLTLTDGGTNESRSAFTTQPVAISDQNGFTAHFIWNSARATFLADGIVFTVQNDPRGPAALGNDGNDIGYQGNGSDGIINSGGFALDNYDNNGPSGGSGIAQAVGGVIGTRVGAGGIVTSTDPVEVDVNYAGGILNVLLTDLKLGTTASAAYPMDFNALLGGTTGYVGITGATGAQSSTQSITDFIFSNNTFVSISIPNAVTAAAGTRSTIQIPAGGVASVGPVAVMAGSVLTLSANGSGTALSSTALSSVVLTAPSLTIAGATGAWTGTFDIGPNALDVTGGNLALITNQVRSGYNQPGGANWNGPGITSSAAGGDTAHLTAVGVIQNNQSGSPIYSAANPFDGTAAGPGDILIKYTYFGDANLDGKVDGSDYSLIDTGYAAAGTLTGWYYGDFNYDGVIDGSDYALIDNAFNNQAASLSATALTAEDTAQVAPPAAVPEPVSAGTAAILIAGLCQRRRDRSGPASGSRSSRL